jgi:predicted enzyme related to lactoylglutathione lyase
MDPVVHFEMPFEDRERMAKFYRSAFGWQTEMLGEEMGSYVLATTVETGEKGPKRPGAINGGFYPKRPDWPAQHPSIVIAVDDITKAIAKVTEAGGNVLGEPMEIPGVGSYVSFMDPEGNRVSMLQPIPRNWHAPKKKAKKKIVKKKIAKKKAAKAKAGKKRKAGRRTAGKRA